MKIVLLTAYFPPDVGSAAHLFFDLGKSFLARGHQVTVITGFPSYHAQGDLSGYRSGRWRVETRDGMRVVRVRVPELARNTPIGRGIWQFSCAAAFTLAALRESRPDVALVYSPPLPLGLSAWALRAQRGVPFVLNVQDLFPQSAIDLGVLHNPALVRIFEVLEKALYRRADAVTVHSQGNRDHVIAHGGRPDRTQVMENTVDVREIQPGPRANTLRKELGVGDRFVASFGGIMGYSQDLDVILDAAEILRNRTDILFLLAGEGVEKERLQSASRARGLENVLWLPMLPREAYPRLLEASDVCLTTLHAQVKTPVVPSKILSAMAAGRPVVAALDPSGDAPKLIERAGAGYSLPPEDAPALARAVQDLADHPEKGRSMGESGRRFAEENLSPDGLVRQYERLFAKVIEDGGRSDARPAERPEQNVTSKETP